MNRTSNTCSAPFRARHSRWHWMASLALAALMALAANAAEKKPVLSDRNITEAVETELLLDPAVASHLIDVSTDEGIVTLSGSVDNLLSKERAVKLAQTIKGVRAVIDRMTVKPVARTDQEIKHDVTMALLRDPAADSYEVDVQVNDGVVTLVGDVQSWQEKQLAAQVAKGVRGVEKVRNQLAWKVVRDRSDGEIEHEVERRLENDVWVDSTFIAVEVTNGIVKLAGNVGSAIEKAQANANAWVSGVIGVNDRDLNVATWVRDKKERKSRPVKSDLEIKEAIRMALLYDPRVFSFNPAVEVEDGVVTLSGVVDNLTAKRAAYRDAQNTVGVVAVKNRLKVRPKAQLSDQEIAGNIKQALQADPYLDRSDVSVYVLNNKAYLSGTVNSLFEKQQAEELAAQVKGVADVQNDLLANYAFRSYDQWGSQQNLWTKAVPTFEIRNGSADVELRERIEDQLFWSPFVDSDDISVTVDDGVATLKGTVEDRMERGAAIDNAYQAGAVWVDDRLRINPGS